jgi:DNA-binding IclR family transcriptional regulator
MSKIVGRTLDFLEMFAKQGRPLSPSEIARLLDIPASSCHDVLQALQERGYVYELTSRGGYYPTSRIYDVAKAITDKDPVVLRTEPLLRSLRDATDESVLLCKVSGLRATYLATFESSHPLRFLVRVGDSVGTLYATSAGKALLAQLDPEALAAYLQSVDLKPLTRFTITSRTGLRDDLAAGVGRGWFLNREESQEGVTTISARFVWVTALYIVTIAGPAPRMATKLDDAVGLLLNACRLLQTSTGV